MSHHRSVHSNVEHFKQDALAYDSKPTVQSMTDLFAMSLLQYDPASPPAPTEWDDDKIQQARARLPGPTELPRHLVRDTTRVLDFACGTGLVLEKVAPYMARGEFVGVDISPAMLAQFDARAAALVQQHPHLRARLVCGDILDPAVAAPWRQWADVLVCTLSFHHIHDYGEVARVLKTLVRPGGWILIYDFYNEDVERAVLDEAAAKGVSRHGLSIQEMEQCLAGCEHVSATPLFSAEVWEEPRFIESHCPEHIWSQMDKLPRKGDKYLVRTSILLGVAQVAANAA